MCLLTRVNSINIVLSYTKKKEHWFVAASVVTLHYQKCNNMDFTLLLFGNVHYFPLYVLHVYRFKIFCSKNKQFFNGEFHSVLMSSAQVVVKFLFIEFAKSVQKWYKNVR